jgi:hypothetical protein
MPTDTGVTRTDQARLPRAAFEANNVVIDSATPVVLARSGLARRRNRTGIHRISTEDFAVAAVDEAANAKHNRERVSVGYGRQYCMYLYNN